MDEIGLTKKKMERTRVSSVFNLVFWKTDVFGHTTSSKSVSRNGPFLLWESSVRSQISNGS